MLSNEKQPTLSQVKYFVAVARQLSFRRAAQSLGVSQPTLTAQIQALEKNMSVSLFERNRHGTLLTPQGKALLGHADKILQATRRFNDTARELVDGATTTYRLGVPPTLGPYLLPHILPELHKRFNKLKFYVREGAPQQLEDGLLNGDFDLIISPASHESSQLVVAELFTEPLKLVMPSDHTLAGHAYIQPSQIKGEKVLTLEDTHHFHYQIQRICRQIDAHVHRDYEGTSLDTLRQMVVMGVGVSFLPGLYVHSELHRPDELHVCELLDMPITRLHHLIWRNTAPSRVFFKELSQFIRTIVAHKLADVVTVSSNYPR